jgi:hypothetical protein
VDIADESTADRRDRVAGAAREGKNCSPEEGKCAKRRGNQMARGVLKGGDMKTNKTNTKKLVLKAETFKTLGDVALRAVAGGYSGFLMSCHSGGLNCQ